MVAGYSSRFDYNSPTDRPTGGWENDRGSTGGTLYVLFRSESTSTTTGTVSYPVPERYSGASSPWPIPVEELKRAAKRARFAEELKQLRKQLDAALRSEVRAQAAPVGKLPPRHHPLERARNGFQQMCRIPCYRGVRTR